MSLAGGSWSVCSRPACPFGARAGLIGTRACLTGTQSASIGTRPASPVPWAVRQRRAARRRGGARGHVRCRGSRKARRTLPPLPPPPPQPSDSRCLAPSCVGRERGEGKSASRIPSKTRRLASPCSRKHAGFSVALALHTSLTAPTSNPGAPLEFRGAVGDC